MRALVDFHHGSLLRSLVLLLQDRLGMEVYRPIGLDWYPDNWAVFPAEATARQYLAIGEQMVVPADGTPPLNEVRRRVVDPKQANWGGEPWRGVFEVYDSGRCSTHWACSLDYFMDNDFDLLVASLPQHLPIFDRLAEHQRKRGNDCQVIMQVGNEWDLTPYIGRRLLASLRPRPLPAVDVCWYHQEFEQTFFRPRPALPTGRVSCFMNVLHEQGDAWRTFTTLEQAAPELSFRSFGGQCRDGCAWGHEQMGDWLADSMAVLHPKRVEGYGHVIYNAFSVGRPVLVHREALRPFLCDELLRPGTFIDLGLGRDVVLMELDLLHRDAAWLREMGEQCRAAFDAAVDFAAEAERVGEWLGIGKVAA